jgi:WD40 repeat protein
MSGGPRRDDSDDAHAATIDASGEIALAKTMVSPTAPLALLPEVGQKRALTLEQADRYERRGELGRGGIGRVLLVFDSHLGREIALKELLSQASPGGGMSIGVAARFLREARITGQLEHPGIVPVYELGQREDGSLYYTMRRIRGRSLAHALEGAREIEDRLKLLGHFRGVCEAMAFAHSHGVVHRDLKPDNVMVGEFGETLVVDWGLAKVRGEGDPRATEIEDRMSALRGPGADATVDGHVIGTPAYMSPEQARGELDAIDERSDVWGLGAMLFEILTGRPPHQGENAVAILRSVLEERPPRVRDLAPRAPPELAAIVDRALTIDPSSRYPNAAQLAAEIAAFQDGGRVHAYDYGSIALAKRFVRRHKAASIAALVVLFAVLCAAIFSLDRYRSERAARTDAESRRDEAIDQRERAEGSEAAAQIAVAEALLDRAEHALDEGDPAAAAIYAAGALVRDPARGDAPERSARALSAYIDAEEARRFVFVRRIEGADARAGLSPDGRTLVMHAGGDLVVETLATGDRRTIESAGAPVLLVLDGERAAIAGERPAVISLADGSRLAELPPRAWSAALASDRLAVSTEDGHVLVYDARTLEERDRFTVPGRGRTKLAWSGRGLFAIATEEAEVLRYPWPRGVSAPERLPLSAPPFSIAASNESVVVGLPDPEILRFSAQPLAPQRSLSGRGWTTDLLWVNESLLASAESARVVVRDRDGRQLDTLHVPMSHGISLESGRGPAPSLLALPVPDESRTPRGSLFRWERESARSTISMDESVRYVADDRIRRRVVVATLRSVWAVPLVRERLGAPARIFSIPSEHGHPVSLTIARDGAIAVVTSRGTVLLYERDAPVLTVAFEGRAPNACLFGVAFDPDDDVLYAGDHAGNIRRYSRRRHVAIESLFGHEGSVCGLSVRHDGARIASASADGTLRLWNLRSGRVEQRISIGNVVASDVAFDPSGQRVAVGDDRGHLSIYQGDGEQITRIDAHGDWLNRIAWSPDGQRLATTSDDRTVRVFAAATGRLERVWRFDGIPLALAFGDEHLLLHAVSTVLRVPVRSAYSEYEPAELLRRAEQRAGVTLSGLDLVAQ